MIDLVDAVVELAVLAVNRADDASIFPEIDRILGRVAQFDISVVFSYPPSGKPEVLHDGLKEVSLPNAMGDYLAGGYLLDAVYVACKQDLPDGLYRLSALAPDAFFESEYFLSPLVHPCISMESGSLVEEIAFCAHAPDETILVYSLMRSRGGRGFFRAGVCRPPVICSTHQRNHDASVASSRETGSIETGGSRIQS
ncbi:hypothetical protein [Acetobacter sp. UBA5411]|uniref:hypothetical protein n=1 Tax=Acetobacter sp. UBA5411 TaxID=1945905 RepID=UPI0025BA7958|nr:hypothetical protein [Acetobacter sp. UBA5411]